jgi:hypothetical protein
MGLKALPVAAGYDIRASIVPEKQIDGFGLQLTRQGDGFSWEWFQRESGDVFRKIQGGGQVQVRFRTVGDVQELAEVYFIDNVTMRIDRYWLVPFHHSDTDELVIKRGSVLWLGE